MTDLADLTAVDLTHAYEARECSPVEVLRAVRQRIDRWEPTINALWYRDDAEADRQARASEVRRPPRWPGTPRSTSAPISAARCACPPRSPAWSGTREASAVSRSTRRITRASPVL